MTQLSPSNLRTGIRRRSIPHRTAVPQHSRPTRPLSHGPLQRMVFGSVGILLVGLGIVGVIVPGLPTTPFVLLAGWCFSRSFPAMNTYLQRCWLLGRVITDWQRQRGITRQTRITACLMVAAAVSFSVLAVRQTPGLMLLIATAGLVGLATILLLPGIRRIDSNRA